MATLELRALEKTYVTAGPATRSTSGTVSVPAVVDASVAFDAGTIHAVCGENGAGKSTLLRIAAGLVTKDAGRVLVDGKELSPHTPSGARNAGVAIVTQHFALAPELTVLENIALGERGPLRPKELAERVRDVTARLGFTLRNDARVSTLSVGDKQRVELCRAFLTPAKALILDEPTAILTPSEVHVLYTMLRRVADAGTLVVVVTHKLPEVERYSDVVTVMRRGRVVSTAKVPKGEGKDAFMSRVVKEIMGDASRAPTAKRTLAVGEPVLEVADIPGVPGFALTVRAGEVVGIAGIEGNGQADLVDALFEPYGDARVRVDGRPKVRGDISFVHEDRHAMGLVLQASAAENLVLGDLRDVSRGPFIDDARLHAEAARRAKMVAYTRELDVPAEALSGGNQQKLVTGRALGRDKARVLVFVHPTRGVDIGAASEIHAQILVARERGAAVIVVSSDLDELRALSDRIVVVSKHAFAGEFPPDVSDEALGLAMLTGSAT